MFSQADSAQGGPLREPGARVSPPAAAAASCRAGSIQIARGVSHECLPTDLLGESAKDEVT